MISRIDYLAKSSIHTSLWDAPNTGILEINAKSATTYHTIGITIILAPEDMTKVTPPKMLQIVYSKHHYFSLAMGIEYSPKL